MDNRPLNSSSFSPHTATTCTLGTTRDYSYFSSLWVVLGIGSHAQLTIPQYSGKKLHINPPTIQIYVNIKKLKLKDYRLLTNDSISDVQITMQTQENTMQHNSFKFNNSTIADSNESKVYEISERKVKTTLRLIGELKKTQMNI